MTGPDVNCDFQEGLKRILINQKLLLSFMSEAFWYMVEIYRKHDITKPEYSAFKSEIRRISNLMTQLSLEEVIYDTQTYPDTHELTDPVMDVRLLENSGLPKVKEILNSTKYLQYEVKQMKYEDD